MPIKFAILILSFTVSLQSLAQLTDADKSHFLQLEDSIRALQLRVFHSKKDANKLEANKQFLALWSSTLLASFLL